MSKNPKIHTGIIIDDKVRYSLQEVCYICDVDTDFIIELVEYGILEPQGKVIKTWEFSANELQRSKKAIRLKEDLEINLSGVAMALELLEEINELQNKLTKLEQQMKLFDLKLT